MHTQLQISLDLDFLAMPRLSLATRRLRSVLRLGHPRFSDACISRSTSLLFQVGFVIHNLPVIAKMAAVGKACGNMFQLAQV